MNSRLKRISTFFRLILPILLKTGRRPVLFVRPGAMGDILCTFPAVLELKKRHPKATFIYSCQPDFACLPRLAGVTHHVTSAYFDRASLWSRVFSASYHFDYNTEASKASEATIAQEFCRQHSVTSDKSHSLLQISPASTAKVQNLLKQHGLRSGPIILLHPGPSWAIKHWSTSNWAELVVKLREHGLTNIIQLGVNKQSEFGPLSSEFIPGVISLVNQLSVEETVALTALSQLLIGIDSGLMHIATSVGVPAVGLFGPTSPQFLYAPTPSHSYAISQVDCQGCHHRSPRLHWVKNCPHNIKCMNSISVAEVLKHSLFQLKAVEPKP